MTTTRRPERLPPTAGDTKVSVRERLVRTTLAVAGLVAALVGAAILLAPRSFIDIDGTPTADLLSETRAPGAVLVGTGAFLLVAATRRRHLTVAALLSTLLYLGYGAGRLLSMATDGWPSAAIVGATIIELGLGVASLAALRAARGSEIGSPKGRAADLA